MSNDLAVASQINDDDDLVSVSELFARADPAPTAATAPATPAAGTHKRQVSEAVPRDERLTGLRQPPRRRCNHRLWGVPRRPRGQIQALAQALAQPMTRARAAGPGSPNGAIEVQLQSMQCKRCLRIARIAQLVTPVTVIHLTARAQSRVATLHLIVHELIAFLVVSVAIAGTGVRLALRSGVTLPQVTAKIDPPESSRATTTETR
jgi:hypothetical protein